MIDVKSWLEPLRWDGVDRIASIANRACFEKSDRAAKGLATYLHGAVQRVLEPGYEVMTALVLGGPEGVGKTRLLQAIAGDGWYQVRGQLGQHMLRACSGTAVTTVELAGISPTQAKMIVVTQRDKYRPSGSHQIRDVPRTWVPVITTNDPDRYEGSRRFCVVRVRGSIPVAEIARDRDQIWAQAVAEIR